MKKKDAKKWLREAAHENADLIGKSQVFLSIFSERMIEEAVPLLQLGLAVMLDKPILILAPTGATIPMNVRRLAIAIEEYEAGNEESFKAASMRLLQRAVT